MHYKGISLRKCTIGLISTIRGKTVYLGQFDAYRALSPVLPWGGQKGPFWARIALFWSKGAILALQRENQAS